MLLRGSDQPAEDPISVPISRHVGLTAEEKEGEKGIWTRGGREGGRGRWEGWHEFISVVWQRTVYMMACSRCSLGELSRFIAGH